MSSDTTTSGTTKAGKGKGAKSKDGQKSSGFFTLSRKSKDESMEHPPFEATLPHVNLLPPAVKDAITAGKFRRWLVLAALLLLAIVGGVWYLQSTQISNAEQTLAQAQAENVQLKKGLKDLAGVKDMYGQITRLQDVVTVTMASQPEAAPVIQQLVAAGDAASAGGSPIAFSTFDVSYTGIPRDPSQLNPCPNPNPFALDVTIGCVNFTGTAANRQQVAEFLRALEADPMFIGPFVPTTSVNEGSATEGTASVIAFSGSSGVSLEALKTKLTPEQIAAIVHPPKPSASPSPSAAGGTS